MRFSASVYTPPTTTSGALPGDEAARHGSDLLWLYLYLCTSSVTSWHCVQWTLPFFTFACSLICDLHACTCVSTHTYTILGISVLVCFNRFSLHPMKSRCMCLSILAGGIYGHTHIQFTLGLDELLILVNTPPGSMLYNSIRYYAYWLSCLSRRVHSLAALIHVGWLWIGTYVLFPLFSSLSRIFLLVPGRKNFSLCWPIWTAFHSAHDTSVTTYVLIYRRWFVQVPHDVQPVHTCDRLGVMHNAVEFTKFFWH